MIQPSVYSENAETECLLRGVEKVVSMAVAWSVGHATTSKLFLDIFGHTTNDANGIHASNVFGYR